MSRSIRVRELTKEELGYKDFRDSQVGKMVVSLGQPMSIMGMSDNFYVSRLNVNVGPWKKEYLGDGEYFYDGPSAPDAKGGQTVSVLWSASDAFVYMRNAAEALSMKVFCDREHIYFKTKYTDVFLEAFIYVDRTLHTAHESTFFLSHFFGWGIPQWNSKESKSIQRAVLKILAKSNYQKHG